MKSILLAAQVAAMVWLGGLAGGCSVSGDLGPRDDLADSRSIEPDVARPASESLPGSRPADPRVGPLATEPPRTPEPGLRYSMAYPTGVRSSSVLLLEADGPREVRVGQPFSYTLRVTNLTGSPLHGVSVYAISNELTASSARPAAAAIAPDDRPTPTAATTPARQDSASWNVGTLAPRESRTHQVESVGDEVGLLNRCLGVTYTPTLCTTVRVVHPELRLSKEAPADILICEELTYRYTVTNVGTGTATAVRINEALPDGMTTQGGEKTIALDVGDLPEGQSRTLTVKVRPAHVGQYTSRASAISGDARSDTKEITTVVREPVLAVAVEGPEARYAYEQVDFRVTVRNTGDAPAEHAVLHLSSPDVPDKFADRDLGTIEPNGSKSVTVPTHAGAEAGQLRLIASADAACARTVISRGSVTVRTIPALLLECGDSIDPVRVGNTTIYTITVLNQGSGADTNVVVKAIVPPEESYVASMGASEATVDGQTLTFAPIASLAPKQLVQWKVEVKGKNAGDARFNVELTSDSLTRPATKSESTRVVDDAVATPK